MLSESLGEQKKASVESAGASASQSLLPAHSPRGDAMTPRAPPAIVSAAVPPPVAVPPPLVLAAPAACVAVAAALANCALLAALLKLSKTGLYCFVTQIAILDFVLLITTIVPELWTYYWGSWSFGHEGCIAYRGLSVLATTASMYLIVAVALHSLATVNLEEKSIARKLKRLNCDVDEEIRSSRHSLVASSDTSTPSRTMNVEYRLSTVRVPVAPPTTFVWVLSTSLSVPQFVFSTLLHKKSESVHCTLADSSHRYIMHALLVTFTLILPCAILVIVGILILRKLNIIKVCEIDSESVTALKFSVFMILVNLSMCVPRLVVDVYSFHNTDNNQDLIRLVFTIVFLISTLVRPILSAFLLEPLRKLFSFNSNINEDNV